MKLDGNDIQLAWYCATIAIGALREKRRPIPEELRMFLSRLDIEIECASPPGHEIEDAGAQFKPADWIPTREAAAILNKSPRQTRRLKADLGAEPFGRDLLYPRHAVDAYAQELRSDE